MKLKIVNMKHLAHIAPQPGTRKVRIELEGIVSESERDQLIEVFQTHQHITVIGPLPVDVKVEIKQ